MKWFPIQLAFLQDGLVHATNDLKMLVAYVHDRDNRPTLIKTGCSLVLNAVKVEGPITCLECLTRAW